MEGIIMVSSLEQKNFNLAQEVLRNRLSIVEFSTLIGKSYRQSQRIIKRVEKLGLIGVKHGNTGKTPANKTPNEKRLQMQRLLAQKYKDFNLSHFGEKLWEEEGITLKRETLRKWAHQAHLVKKARRRSKKRVHKPRPRMAREGMLIQFDGSEHLWFGPEAPVYWLIGGIDDATSKVLWLEFFESEDSLSCMKVMKESTKRYGVPLAYYLDQAGHFGKQHSEQNTTQIGRALEELNCKVLLANSPQAKGRIERLWGTLQDRLIAELQLHKITTIESGNQFLQEYFIADFNKRFSVSAREASAAYMPLPEQLNIDRVFSLVEERKITQANIFSLNGIEYQVLSNDNLKYRRIKIHTFTDKRIEYWMGNRKVEVKKNLFYNRKQPKLQSAA